jgi:hypothetical protein
MLIFLCSDDKPCKNHIIAFSGFEGEERARIRFMIEATGAKSTSYFTKHNHILVCRRLVVLMRSLHKGPKMYKIPVRACVICYSYYTEWWEEFVWSIYDGWNLKQSPWVADSCSAGQEILDVSWNPQVPTLFSRACRIPGCNSMWQSPSWETNGCSACQETLHMCGFHTLTILFTTFHHQCLSCLWCIICILNFTLVVKLVWSCHHTES